jgi:hypothetical protein
VIFRAAGEDLCSKSRIHTQDDSSQSHLRLELAHLVLEDSDLTVHDQQEYLVIGNKTLHLRIWYSVDAGNVRMFEENLDYLRIAR